VVLCSRRGISAEVEIERRVVVDLGEFLLYA
jgi:hypothetical protein